ncbi:hypothetical protein AB0J83_34190 [Actinoplanes sp. NPDC049596]|uniref:hypothetical protein n=1 Tax=unclassified Actinoplanes TaxID=2626549 RepID=UPI00341AEC3D
MKRRGFLLSAAVAVTGLAAASPARAVSPAAGDAAPNLVADQEAADRDFVRWLSVHDPRALVRSPARSALLHSSGAAAITAFLTSGYKSAAERAATTRVRQLDYANRMAATHAAQFYPWVNAAARRAAAGSDAELAEFSSTGYAAALAKDNAKVPYDDGAARVTQDDRDFAAQLAVLDLGPAVQQRALEVTTDAEVAEFLRYGLSSAAQIDSDDFRALYVAEEWALWPEAKSLTGRAVTAGDPAAALLAWHDVAELAARPAQRWTERQQFAQRRVNDWSAIAGSGRPLLGGAAAVRTQWAAEVTNAAGQTAWWNDLLQYAAAASELRP